MEADSVSIVASVVGLIGVPLLDQTVKLLVRLRLRHGSIPLGPLGALRVAPAPIWLMRVPGHWTRATMWALWTLAAVALAIVGAVVPSLAPSFALILGGSLSHAAEITLRGSICDYMCLRFWPAFDLADVALGAGTVGLLLQLAAAMSGTSP
jgi:lipoprotein signal peptidase